MGFDPKPNPTDSDPPLAEKKGEAPMKVEINVPEVLNLFKEIQKE